MKYLTYYSGSYVPKNQLEKDQIEFMRSKDRILLNNEQALEEFKLEVINGLKKINQVNHRCNPMFPSWHRNDINDRDHFLSSIRVVNFYIYKVESEQS